MESDVPYRCWVAALNQFLPLSTPCFRTNWGKAMSKHLNFCNNWKCSTLPSLNLTFASRPGLNVPKLPPWVFTICHSWGVLARHWKNCDHSSSHSDVLMDVRKLGEHLYFNITSTSVTACVLVALGSFEAPQWTVFSSLFIAQNLLERVYFCSSPSCRMIILGHF